MYKIFVIIPSKTRNSQNDFLLKALKSVYDQTILKNHFEINVLVVYDKGKIFNDEFYDLKNTTYLENIGNNQASALNTAIDKILDKDGYVTFLEDDDYWMDNFLETAVNIIKDYDFVSSNQIEINEKKEILQVLDVPTPSGWFMKIDTLRKVGKFNESFKWHLDNEWIGRLNQSKLKRCHLIESGAQVLNRTLLKVISNYSALLKHNSPFPLIFRSRHSEAGMNLISTNNNFKKISENEYEILKKKFGGIGFTI